MNSVSISRWWLYYPLNLAVAVFRPDVLDCQKNPMGQNRELDYTLLVAMMNKCEEREEGKRGGCSQVTLVNCVMGG